MKFLVIYRTPNGELRDEVQAETPTEAIEKLKEACPNLLISIVSVLKADHPRKWTEPVRLALVMQHTGCSEAEAWEYLRAEEGDEVEAIRSYRLDRRIYRVVPK